MLANSGSASAGGKSEAAGMKTEELHVNQPWSQCSLPHGLLQEREVHVWRFGLNVHDLALHRFRGWLCETEIIRSDRFRLPHLRRRFVAARGALRSILAGYLSMHPRQLTFSYGPYGKPSVRNSPHDIRFNLSHSNDLMILAVCGRGCIGVDIEKEDPHFPTREIAARYFCEGEKKQIAQADDKADLAMFFQLWTAKEAVMKATALGLSLEPAKVEIGFDPLRVLALEAPPSVADVDWRLLPFCPAEGYRGTLALTAEPLRLEYRSLCLT
jgi:4'-phosphopantetheinyl transferase